MRLLHISAALVLTVGGTASATAQRLSETALAQRAEEAGASAADAAALVRAVQARDAKLTAADAAALDNFGASVSLSGDRALVGASGVDCPESAACGAAYVFVRTESGWTQEAELTASEPDENGQSRDRFGSAVSLLGDRALVGAPGDDCSAGFACGAVYVFVRTGSGWIEEARLTADDASPSDGFGEAVSLAGSRALIGAPRDNVQGDFSGSAYVFVRAGSTWTEEAKLVPSDPSRQDLFGRSVSLSGDRALIGASTDTSVHRAGSAYVFVRTGAGWSQEVRLTDTVFQYDRFGSSVSLLGDRALVGAPGAGKVVAFARSGGGWTLDATLTAADGVSGEDFGASLSLAGDRALIGAPKDDDRGGSSGSAYTFVRSESGWAQESKITVADGAGGDRFGNAVSLSGERLLVGAVGFDGFAGAAYAFDAIPTVPLAVGNDRPETAAPVSGGRTAYAGSTVSAPADDGATAPSCASGDAAVWWYLRATASGTVAASTAGSDFDTVLSVWSVGADGRPAAQVACDDDGGGAGTSALAVSVAAGGLYLVRVSGRDGASGEVALSVSGAPVTGPPGDDRSAPLALADGAGARDTNVGATAQPGEPAPSCGADGGNSVWRRFTAPGPGRATVDLSGSGFDAVLAVYAVAGGPPVEVGCDDGRAARAVVDVEAGAEYAVRVSGSGGAEGEVAIAYTFEPAVASDADAAPTLTLTAGPNPSAGPVRLAATVAEAGPVRVEVFDALGRRVAVLHDGPSAAGPAAWTWDGAAPAGVYVARLTAGAETRSRRLVVAR